MSQATSSLSLYKHQRGQLFSGYIVAVFAVMGMVLIASAAFVKQKQLQERQRYRNWAENMAKYGFESTVSYFRNDPNGRFLPDSIAPISQAWQGTSLVPTAANPWMGYPDLAFAPTALDTDYFSLLQVPPVTTLTGTAPNYYGYNTATFTAARAMIRTIPLNYSEAPSAVPEVRQTRYWGRFVVKRQPTRNWSPGGNTYSVFTDKDAVHDLSHLQDNVRPGSGTTWSIVSQGYVYSYPNTGDLPTAALEGGDITGAPFSKYLGRRLLLAKAKVYGKITRVNILNPAAAVWVNSAASLSITCNGAIIARDSTSYGYAYKTGAATFQSGCAAPNTNGSNVVYSAGNLNLSYSAPDVNVAFPGQTMATLKTVALALSSQTATSKVGNDATVFPLPSSSGFENTVSTNAFYYIDGDANLTGSISARRMSGIGMVAVNGNLIIPAGNPSEFSGIVFVKGNVYLGPGVSISGILIATGWVYIGAAGSSLKSTVEFSQDAIDNTRDNVLRSFQVLESSVVAVN